MSGTHPQIPYGWADFQAMRRERTLYVDKTRFLHDLEQERYAFLIRPRRFGKSCWVSLLAYYYDRTRADSFATLFAGTDIGRRPTPNRHRYVILHFDFSAFDDTLETLRERFETYCEIVLRYALEANGDLFPQPVIDRILAHPSIDGRLTELFERGASARPDRHQRPHRLRQAAPPADGQPAVERQLRPVAPRHRRGLGG